MYSAGCPSRDLFQHSSKPEKAVGHRSGKSSATHRTNSEATFAVMAGLSADCWALAVRSARQWSTSVI